MQVWIYTDTSKNVSDPQHLRVFATKLDAQRWFQHNRLEGAAFAYQTLVVPSKKRSSAREIEANLIKTLLVLSVLILGISDLFTTNVILNRGLHELNPFMHFAQTWLGVWWLIPKLTLTYFMMWLLWRSNNPYNIAIVVAFCSAPVLNNLLIIVGAP
ncbi:DUF5658 family protein [Bradyrhizobium sp. CCBAU 53338]|uniref:DUF5658 family protein n=1 Tax=Bradyrhizobium sp. CCBAU 53338 TaxID=1325111 RepID=UPI0018C14034|nr:DUF5658 family protein [Bradyrhizobium sp. CCBAU 53338]QOZ52218.1 hypothetical protein XH90_13175 [Bradyrhizobium sp. CCBAU 53338]